MLNTPLNFVSGLYFNVVTYNNVKNKRKVITIMMTIMMMIIIIVMMTTMVVVVVVIKMMTMTMVLITIMNLLCPSAHLFVNFFPLIIIDLLLSAPVEPVHLAL